MSKIVETSASDRIWSVRLNRPEARNVLSIELMKELTEVAQRLHDESDVRAVILTANGEHFTAGVDLKDPMRWDHEAASLAERRAFACVGDRMCQAWEDIPAMTICAVEGHCVGGGVALAASIDLRIVGASAYFWLPEIALGIPLSWGALPRLVRMLGPAKAKRAIILGDKLVGKDAVDFGIADYLAPDGRTYAEALELARRITELPEVSVKMSKEAINVTANALNRLASFMGRDQLALAVQSEEAVAARARFAAGSKKRTRGA